MVQGIEFYEQTADNNSLEQFVLEHRSLVRKIALHIKRRLPSHIDVEDLLQSGFIGLLEARKSYKDNMGASFETFASIRIRGAIIDSLRKNSWGTREAVKNMRLIGDAITRIEQRNHKQPTTEEIAQELGITPEEHIKICQQISVCNVISLDVMDNEDAQFGNYEQDPEELTEKEEMKEKIKETLTLLPEKEQIILSLYYIEEFTFKQIGEILDLTEARICQLHSQAISRIQSKLRKDNL